MESQRDKDIAQALPLCGHDEDKAAIYADGMMAGRRDVLTQLFALMNSEKARAATDRSRAAFDLWCLIRDFVQEVVERARR